MLTICEGALALARITLLIIIPFSGYGYLRAWIDGVQPDSDIYIRLLVYMSLFWLAVFVEPSRRLLK